MKLDFYERCSKISEYKKADANSPRMGLNNKICIDPKYWCRLHQVWLSDKDVECKKCLNKPTLDLISNKRCTCLEMIDYCLELEKRGWKDNYYNKGKRRLKL